MRRKPKRKRNSRNRGRANPKRIRGRQIAFTQVSNAPPSFSLFSYPVDLAFTVTFNGVQGATVKRVVIVATDLGQARLGTLTLPKFGVGLSRVKHGRHVAIFVHGTADLLNLTKLRHSDKAVAWQTHYDRAGSWRAHERIVLPSTFPAGELSFLLVAFGLCTPSPPPVLRGCTCSAGARWAQRCWRAGWARCRLPR